MAVRNNAAITHLLQRYVEIILLLIQQFAVDENQILIIKQAYDVPNISYSTVLVQTFLVGYLFARKRKGHFHSFVGFFATADLPSPNNRWYYPCLRQAIIIIA